MHLISNGMCVDPGEGPTLHPEQGVETCLFYSLLQEGTVYG